MEERGGAKEEGGARERERKEEGGAREVPPEKCQYLPKPESKTKEKVIQCYLQKNPIVSLSFNL